MMNYFRDMDLKDYRVQPDEGLFEKISQRVRRRRMMRQGGIAAAVVVVAAVLCVVLWPASDGKVEQMAMLRTTEYQLSDVRGVTDVTADKSSEIVRQAPKEVLAGDEVVMPVVAQHSDVETEADLTALVPTFTHVVTAQPLPLQKEVEKPGEYREAESAGPARQENEKEDADNNTIVAFPASPVVSDAMKSGEQSLHEDNLFWAPNIIVPSGDVDANRTFTMKFTSAVTQFRIYIYNRGGRQVFYSTDPSFVWDGTSKGTVLPQGAYVWVASFRDGANRLHNEKGTVTVVR